MSDGPHWPFVACCALCAAPFCRFCWGSVEELCLSTAERTVVFVEKDFPDYGFLKSYAKLPARSLGDVIFLLLRVGKIQEVFANWNTPVILR